MKTVKKNDMHILSFTQWFLFFFIAECVYTAFQVKVYVTTVSCTLCSDVSPFLLYWERSRRFSWDLHYPQPVQVHTKYNVTTEFKANVQILLHISAMSFISFFIFYYNSQNSLFVSFLSDYNTSFYRNYKNNTSREPH